MNDPCRDVTVATLQHVIFNNNIFSCNIHYFVVMNSIKYKFVWRMYLNFVGFATPSTNIPY